MGQSVKKKKELRNGSMQVCPTDYWQGCKDNSMKERQILQHTVLVQLPSIGKKISKIKPNKPQPKSHTFYKN